jgi:tRNA pseudouridine55 synthase
LSRRRNKKGLAIHGILLLDKQLGFSSNASLQKAKRLFNAQKAGHTGSLDPLATGMLPICFGEATKVSAFLLESNKCYQTTAQLGQTRTTGDAEGKVVLERDVANFSIERIQAVLAQFTGEISQIPPMYSALKKDGRPLYELARKGQTVERKARNITIHSLQLLQQTETTLELKVACSKGTYIRTLVEDIGEVLGCGAYVSQLKRSMVSPFEGQAMVDFKQLEQAKADQGQEALYDYILPIDYALKHWDKVSISNVDSALFKMGQTVKVNESTLNKQLRVYSEESKFLGIGYIKHENSLAPKRVMQMNEQIDIL